VFLPRDAMQSAVLLQQSRLSICLSVTFRYCDHIGRNSLKIISRSVSLAFRTPQTQHHKSTLRGTPLNFDRNRMGYGKCGFQRTKAVISLKHGKIGPRLLSLLLRTMGSPKRAFDCANVNDLGWLKDYYALSMTSLEDVYCSFYLSCLFTFIS